MKKIYHAPETVRLEVKCEGGLLAGSNRITGAVLKNENTQVEANMNVGQDVTGDEDDLGLAKGRPFQDNLWDEDEVW
jgi:hypothetical protein